MDTDRELLELAAKAIGGEFSPGTTRKRVGPTWDAWEWAGPIGIKKGSQIHYPLTNYADAFRMASALGLTVEFGNNMVIHPSEVIGEGADPLAATCCAIVLAAAAIGKAMP
jgi:hypothetical protein